jgi:hypothetical protein
MPYTSNQISVYLAKAQRAIASRMTKAARLETLGNSAIELYLQCRYLSAGIRVLNSNHGLTIDEVEKIIHCMIECGDINEFEGSALTFPPIIYTKPPCCPTAITDLTDGPGGGLQGHESQVLRVNPAGTAWEWFTLQQNKVIVKNMIFVSSENGNDDTALIERMDFPFATRSAALAAASDGFTIVVFPGSYTNTGLAKNGVDWFTFPGVKNYIDAPLYGLGSPFTSNFNVTGDEYIYPPEDDQNNEDVAIVTCSGTSVINITIGGYEVPYSGRYAILDENANVNITSKGRIYSISHPNANSDVANDASLTINAPEIYFNAGLYTHAGSPRITVNASNRNVFYVDIADLGVSSATLLYNSGGTIIVNGPISAGNAPYSSFEALIRNTGSALKTVINGDVVNGTSYASTSQRIMVSQGGIVEINGNITGYRGLSVSGGTAYLNGSIVIDNNNASAFTQSAGTVYINNRIKNLKNNSASHAVLKSGGTMILDNAKLIVTHASANSISAATAQNVVVMSGYSNVGADVDVTQIGNTISENSSYQ